MSYLLGMQEGHRSGPGVMSRPRGAAVLSAPFASFTCFSAIDCIVTDGLDRDMWRVCCVMRTKPGVAVSMAAGLRERLQDLLRGQDPHPIRGNRAREGGG